LPVTLSVSPSTKVKFGSAIAPVVVPSLVKILWSAGSVTALNPVPEVPEEPSPPDAPSRFILQGPVPLPLPYPFITVAVISPVPLS
jgi:hypothetical protein